MDRPALIRRGKVLGDDEPEDVVHASIIGPAP